jgi:hypothetical protein
MLPADLRQLGCDVTEMGEGERILASAITQKMTLTSCGVFEEITEGSTKPIAETRTHAGIVRVVRTPSP